MLDGSIAGPLGQRADLRDVEPPAPAAGVHEREPRDEARRRRGPSRRVGRGEDLAVRALRAVDLVLSVLARTTTSPRSASGSRTSASRRRGAPATPRARTARRCSSRCSAARAPAASRGSSRRATPARRRSPRRPRRGARPNAQRDDRHHARRGRGGRAAGRPGAARAAPRGQGLRRLLGVPGRQARARRDAGARARARALRGARPRGAARRAVARAGVRLPARARRAPFLPRVRVGRRAARPRRPGVRLADARAPSTSRRCCPRTRGSCRRCCCRRSTASPAPPTSARTAFLVRASRAFAARLATRAVAREGLAGRSRSPRSRRGCATLAHAHGAKVLLNGAADAARRLGLDGVHWTSARLAAATSRPDDLVVGASCHDARGDRARGRAGLRLRGAGTGAGHAVTPGRASRSAGTDSRARSTARGCRCMRWAGSRRPISTPRSTTARTASRCAAARGTSRRKVGSDSTFHAPPAAIAVGGAPGKSSLTLLVLLAGGGAGSSSSSLRSTTGMR